MMIVRVAVIGFSVGSVYRISCTFALAMETDLSIGDWSQIGHFSKNPVNDWMRADITRNPHTTGFSPESASWSIAVSSFGGFFDALMNTFFWETERRFTMV